MLKCPKCGNTDLSDIRYVEDIQCWRKLVKLENGVLYIDGLYTSDEGYDDGENPRFECQHTPDSSRPWDACGHRWKAVLERFDKVEWVWQR